MYKRQNPYRIKQAKDALLAKFLDNYGDLAVEQIDASKIDQDRLMQLIVTLPFLVSEKLIIIRELSHNKDLVEPFLDNIEQIPDTNHVLVIETNLDNRSKFAKQLKSNAALNAKKFDELSENDLAKWAMDVASEQGASLNKNAAVYLIERVGKDQLQLQQELRKLRLYTENIDKQAIEELTEPTLEGNVFNLTDALAHGDYAMSLQIYQQLRRAKLDAVYVFTMISWQLQNIAMVKAIGDQNSSQLSISPYVLRKTQPISRRLSNQKIKQALKLTLDTDIKLKTKSINPDQIVQNLLIKLAGVF